MFLLTINSHPEDEEGHTVELTTSPNRESESTLTSRKLHGKVLVVLRQVGVDLLVLLKEKKTILTASHPILSYLGSSSNS